MVDAIHPQGEEYAVLLRPFNLDGETVNHVLMSVSFGDGSTSWEVVRARFESDGGDIPAARRLAEEGHALVLATLDSLPEEALDAPRPYYGGKSHTAAEIFDIVAEHDLYHAGQVNYVKNLLAGVE